MVAERPSTSSPQGPRRQPGGSVRELASVIELPILLVACVGVGGGLGYLLDQRVHTSPLFMLILGGAGFAAGIRLLLKRLSKDSKEDAGS